MRLPILLLTLLFAWPTHAQMTLRNGALRNYVGTSWDKNLVNGLVSYWKLDETSGTRYDSIGTNNLTANNSPSYATGKIGNAATFVRASAQSLTIPHNASFPVPKNSNSYSVSLWVKMNTKSSVQVFTCDKAGQSDLWTIYYDNASDRFMSQIQGGEPDAKLSVATDSHLGSPSTNVWYFLCTSFDYPSLTLSLSVNNLAADTKAVPANKLPTRTDTVVCIGKYNLSGEEFYTDGYIDEVGVWNRVLSATEISTLYKSGVGTTYRTFSHRSRRIPESLYDTPANPLLAALYRKPEPISLDIP